MLCVKQKFWFDQDVMPLPPALAKKLATRGILTENEGKIHKLNFI